MNANTIDLSVVLEMLDTARVEAETLNGAQLDDNGQNNTRNRDRNQRLLALADGLALASSLTRAEYWQGKGVAL